MEIIQDNNVLNYYYSELKAYLNNQYNIEMCDYKKGFKYSYFPNNVHVLKDSLKKIIQKQ